ncbi:hypothetical protein [Macrococcoides caseolyticum]|uniref:hypothetical protein n=1 Tax=Macrococcoides caseolyticum TaxID=69966 RepID=UPI001C5D3E55|nr:hypothetical protein [Macrococcus caseolyticus]QYA34246.1 hypothetical protein KYI08_05870 [Macrococcus caseolyticus]
MFNLFLGVKHTMLNGNEVIEAIEVKAVEVEEAHKEVSSIISNRKNFTSIEGIIYDNSYIRSTEYGELGSGVPSVAAKYMNFN